MAVHELHAVEDDVREMVERVCLALSDPGIDVVVGLVRRLPRILDAVIKDESLKQRVDQKLLYSMAPRLDPSLVADKRIALVDDYIQTGITLRREYRHLRKSCRQVSAFALARSRWHVRNNQYVGLEINEPFMDLEPDDFRLLTSYTNYLLTENSLPLDCEDPVLKVELTGESIDSFLSRLTQIAPLQRLPAPANSKITRYSQFFGANSPLCRHLLDGSSDVSPGEEFKIAWSVDQQESVYLVPIVQYRIRRDPSVAGERDRDVADAARILSPSGVTSESLFEAVHFAASAKLLGRLRRTLADAGSAFTTRVVDNHFRRAYGQHTGELMQQEWLRIAHSETSTFEPGPLGVDRTILLPDWSKRSPLTRAVRNALQAHYRTSNAHVPRLRWQPAGMSFDALGETLKQSGHSVDPDELSAILDHQLAFCWLRTGTSSVDPHTLETHYFSTEQASGTGDEFDETPGDPEHVHRASGADIVSFAKPRDDLAVRLTRGLVAGLLKTLPPPNTTASGIAAGYFKHGLVIIVDMLGRAADQTILVNVAQAHGYVPMCDTSNNFVRGDGSLERNQQVLGLKFAAGANGPIVLSESTQALLSRTQFEEKALLRLREFSDLLTYTISADRGITIGDALIFLSSCRRADVAFDAIRQNLRRVRDSLAQLSRDVVPPQGSLESASDNMSGASDKVRVIASVCGRLGDFIQHNDGLRSKGFMEYLETIDPALDSNPWLAVLSQLICEARYSLRIAQSKPQGLFDVRSAELPSLNDLFPIFREWSQLVDELGFIRDSRCVLPHERLHRRLEKKDAEGEFTFVKIDRARHGAAEDTRQEAERLSRHWPIFRSTAGFYRGFECHDPEGDALVFAFGVGRNALRYAHSLAILCGCGNAVNSFYRVTLATASARFHSDGNVSSAALDVLPEVEAFLRPKEVDVSLKGVTVGSLVDDGLWGCVAADLAARGMGVGEQTSGTGKRQLPRSVLFAVPSPGVETV